MDDFKDSTRTRHISGRKACGHTVRGAAQVAQTMKDFKYGGGQTRDPRKR